MSLAGGASVGAFRAAVREATSKAGELHVVVAYDRRALGQTGSGHFSPVGGLHEGRDLVLLLDVARFKYPPHWVSLEALHRAMLSVDPASGRSRGFLTIQRERAVAPVAALRDADWPEIERFLRDLDGTDLMVLAACLQDGKATIMPRLVEILYSQEEPPAAVKEHVERLRTQIAALQTADPTQVA